MSSDEPTLKPTPRHDELEQCPRCKIPAWDCEQAYGIAPRYLTESVVACPNCHGTIVVKGGAEKGEAEMLEGEPEASISSQVADVLREDRQRGSGQASSSSGAGRKREARHKVERRYEQDPVSGGRVPKQKVSVKKMSSGSRSNITLSPDAKVGLCEWARLQSVLTGKRITMADGVRASIEACLSRLKNVREFEYGGEKESLQVYLYGDDIEALDAVCHEEALDITRGEAIEACLRIWLPEQ